MSRTFGCLALLLGFLPFTANAQDAEAGKAVFRQACGICHAATAGRVIVGPSLFNLVGRKSGSEPNFQYSDANKKAGFTWDAATLDRYLAAPGQLMPGTKMVYAGLKDNQKRQDLVAYLQTLH